MKEIGIFKIDKNMCSNCREDENCPQKYSNNGNCLYGEKDLKKEHVPETWEELKKLCKGLKDVKISSRKTIDIKCYSCWLDGLRFDCLGQIRELNGFQCIALHRTPAQMWQIIKSLIGE